MGEMIKLQGDFKEKFTFCTSIVTYIICLQQLKTEKEYVSWYRHFREELKMILKFMDIRYMTKN